MEDLGRRRGALPRSPGVGDLEVEGRRRVHRGGQEATSRSSPSNCEEKPPLRATDDPDDRMSEKLLDIVPESARQALRHVRRDRARSSTTASIFDIKPKFAKTMITCLARFGGQPVRDRRQPAEAARRHPRERLGRQGGALRQPLRRLQHPARLPPGRAGVHGRLEGRARRDHPPRGEDALRGLAGDGAEDHRGRPQGLRRRLLRDERQGLRAGPDRRLARAPRSR